MVTISERDIDKLFSFVSVQEIRPGRRESTKIAIISLSDSEPNYMEGVCDLIETYYFYSI